MSEKEILHTGQYIRLVRNGRWEYVERVKGKDAAYIIPVVENRFGEPEFIFIREHRVPFDKYVVGFPAGLIGDTEAGEEEPAVAAHRELIEETGYKAGRLRHLTSGPSSSGLSNELLHYFLADRLKKVGKGGGDSTESIEIFNVPLHKAESWLYNRQQYGDLIDSKSYIGLYWANRVIK